MASERTFRIQGASGIRPAFIAAWNLIQGLMRDAGTGYELVLRPLKSKRSVDQNRRYHAMLRDLAAIAWLDGRQYSKEAWHEWAKQEFIGWEDLPGGGRKGISTTKLSIEEFGDYMTRVEQWAAEQGWPLMVEAA
ncbi:recombination protein NinB [Azotobacter vinelandii]|uniref:recombination protein NinB n=1 Tax=Azotobacter vinelandii TaxID=354 RepID=UPI0026667D45|nr:recombination protein NinB [Azotobacter vinelandii]WKN20836.1 recombination protein NinB [Azotobacter vinelandii]